MITELQTQWYHSEITGYEVFVTGYDLAKVYFRDEYGRHGSMPKDNFKALFSSGLSGRKNGTIGNE